MMSTEHNPIITGINIGLNKVVTETSNADAARIVGPPQGKIFMVPAANAVIVANVVRFMFKLS